MKGVIAKLIVSIGAFKAIPLLRSFVRMLAPSIFLDALGVRHGARCRVFNANFGTEPWLIQMGNDVSIGSGVKFITHDGGVWVIRNITGNQRIDYFAQIKIGNNVFIGNDAMILPGVSIGDNVVVGAKALVASDLESNMVYGGVPARAIKTVQEYMEKKISSCVETKGMKGEDRRNMICRHLGIKEEGVL